MQCPSLDTTFRCAGIMLCVAYEEEVGPVVVEVVSIVAEVAEACHAPVQAIQVFCFSRVEGE